MAYNARAVREHRRRQREGKARLVIEVDEADLVATLRLAGFIGPEERDPEPDALEKLVQHVIELWITPPPASACNMP